jgi:Zn-dependent peptidase ImmA (M78 family)
MAIIRKKRFSKSGNISSSDIALIDTPDKLLDFARDKNLETTPLDVKGIADKFGIHVKEVSLEDDLSGKLYRDPETSKWVIEVNKEHHPNRKRYTIAHELAHFCLHRHLKYNFVDRIYFRGGESNKPEWQANEFASAILIPAEKFRERIRSGVTKIEKLANEFQVSTLALRIRAKNLGISGHGL